MRLKNNRQTPIKNEESKVKNLKSGRILVQEKSKKMRQKNKQLYRMLENSDLDTSNDRASSWSSDPAGEQLVTNEDFTLKS